MSEEQIVSGENMMDAADPVETVVDDTTQMTASDEPRQVPLEALQSERAERQRVQDELKMVTDNMQLMMANQRQLQQPERNNDEFNGMSDDDVLTVGEFKKALQTKEHQYQTSIEEIRMTQKHPDYHEIVTKYLPDVLKQNPSLRTTLQKSNDYELAYHLAKNSDSYKESHRRAKKSAAAERIIENSQRPGSLSSVGHASPMNNAKRYRDMSDKDFQKEMSKNLGYF